MLRGDKFNFVQNNFLRSNTDKVLAQLGWQYPTVVSDLRKIKAIKFWVFGQKFINFS